MKAEREALVEGYEAVRRRTEALVEPLEPEDQVVQPMPDASPTKWHLAHTSWFFEFVILRPFLDGHVPFHPQFDYLFNSYYEAAGPRQPRAERGLLTRPTVAQTLRYRAHVDAAMARLAARLEEPAWARVRPLIELGLHHERQHQELILTDIKYTLSRNPLRPVLGLDEGGASGPSPALEWLSFPGGLAAIGHDPGRHPGDAFAFDNESPRHHVALRPFRLASRPVNTGDYLDFIADGGYRDPRLWLADGWAMARIEGWRAPLYWEEIEPGRWRAFTLNGMADLDPAAPVRHLSYFEAWAYASWRGHRLPTEAEWEVAATAPTAKGLGSGQVWEWTASAYLPYPGFRAAPGMIGEYNGKFMVNQMVLRGGSWATPPEHIRPSYRNFLPPSARWQFSGVRLAADL